MKAIDRLEGLLDQKESELDEANEKIESLERELECMAGGWRRSESFKDDGLLPIPRLEMVYAQVDGWREYKVVYRLVYKHLLDHMVAVPLGMTKIGGGVDKDPSRLDLPFRDGVHAWHEAGLFGWPLFKLVPGRPPERVELSRETEAQGIAKRRSWP